jgi:Domain of unknown function (DUF4833)
LPLTASARVLLSAAVFFLAALPSFGQINYVPLFIIERNINANVVHYEARLKDGKIDPHQPVVAYWIMAAEDGRRQELNLLEKIKAYGFNIHPDGVPESYRMVVVSDKKKEIHVFRVGNSVRAEVNLGACDAALQRIFISTHRSFLSAPDYAEMQGTDLSTGAPCSERITPGER